VQKLKHCDLWGAHRRMNKERIGLLKTIPVLDVAKALGIEVQNSKAECFGGHDTKPSLHFWIDKNSWFCFGCGLGGDCIELVKRVKGIGFSEAARWLGEMFNIDGLTQGSSLGRVKSRRIFKSSGPTKQIEEHKGNPEVFEWFVQRLGLSQNGREYLRGRGFSDNTIDYFQVRDLSRPSKIIREMIDKWGYDILYNCGFYKTKPEIVGNEIAIPHYWVYSMWFPFKCDNRVVYLQRRMLNPAYDKYVNLARIRKPLYNVDVLRNLDSHSVVHICEGITDTIMAHQKGLNAVGILGATSVVPEHIELLTPFRIRVIQHNDNPGKLFYTKLERLFLEKGKAVRRVYLGGSNDLCEFVGRKS
jgi:DNA primase